MLCEAVEKYYSFPGFTLLLGSLFHTKLAGKGVLGSHFHLMEVHLYMIYHWGDGHIIEDSGFPRDWDYADYFVEFLESPERSGTHIFDQERYATAAKECLQLYLCSHRNFSKGVPEFAYRDMAICRSKPWTWVSRLGVHSRIRKGRHHFRALRRPVNQSLAYGLLGFFLRTSVLPILVVPMGFGVASIPSGGISSFFGIG